MGVTSVIKAFIQPPVTTFLGDDVVPPIVPVYTANATFFVDKSSTIQPENGSSVAPFTNVADAAAQAVLLGPATSVTINVAPGDYSTDGTITLVQNVAWILQGAVSESCIIPAVVWAATGTAAPFPTSALVLRNLSVASVTINDGTLPAVSATLALENVDVLGDVVQTGTGIIVTLVSGLASANTDITGIQVASIIEGNLNTPHSNVGLTNTRVNGDITCAILSMSGSAANGSIICTNAACEIQTSRLGKTPNPTVTFTGSPGILRLDSENGTLWFSSGSILTNGTLSFVVPVVLKSVVIFHITALPNGTTFFFRENVANALDGDSIVATLPSTSFGDYIQGAPLVVSPGVVGFGLTSTDDIDAADLNVAVCIIKG